MKKLIAQGAEAKIYKENNKIIKERIKKNYRIPEIDQKLRKQRTKQEASLISKAIRAKVASASVLEYNLKKNILEIEYLQGPKIRDYLNSLNENKKKQNLEIKNTSKKIGSIIGKLHEANIIHGDLTTSNMIFKDKEIYIIDFGLGSFSEKIEDKAVDLHLFKECLKSKHYSIWRICWQEFIKAYKKELKNSKKILERLETVEARGRYKKLGTQ